MKKEQKFQIFRYIHAANHYFVVSVSNIEKYKELHKQTVKMVTEFDDLDEAIQFGKAIKML